MARTRAEEQFLQRSLSLLLEEAYRRYLPRIPSRTLRNAMEIVLEADDLRDNEGALFIPHYWAEYLHDGRGPVQPRQAKFIVFFRRPQDDPRLSRGYPIRVSDVRRLTKSEFDQGLARNRRNAELGLPPHMYVLKDERGDPRAAAPSEGTRWFERNEGVSSRVGPEILELFDELIERENVVTERSTARFRLRLR